MTALAKHQFTVKFTELSVDLLISLGERYLFSLPFVLFRKTREQPLLCSCYQYWLKAVKYKFRDTMR